MENNKEDHHLMFTNALEVNRDMINIDFQSYRLNRETKHNILVENIPNNQKIQSFNLTDFDYSFCHSSMLSSINNLFYNRHDPLKVYLITEFGFVLVSCLSTNQSEIKFNFQNVFTISGNKYLLN